MRNQDENQPEQDQKLLNFAPLFLDALQHNDIGRFKEAHEFFKEAFVLLTDHDMFEDIDYRLKWTGYLSFFENISTPLEGYTPREIETAIKTAILTLTKRKEVESGD